MAGLKPLLAFSCLLGLLVLATLQVADAQTGVCYGMLGSLPKPSQVIDLYKHNNIRRMRLYDPYNKDALNALRNSGIEVILGVPNKNDLQYVASNQANANAWIRTNILDYYPSVNFKYIAVGNEVSPAKSDTRQYVQYIVPAMRNIQTALSLVGISGKIKVSTSVEMGLTENTFPPSDGSFRLDVQDYIKGIIQFLVNNNSPLLVNIYPYFAVRDDPTIPLDYALFRSPDAIDGKYHNLFIAMLDGFYAALEKVGAGSMQIVVSETGWPTDGGDKTITTIENARTYNSNLIKRVKNGTPRRPNGAIETYIFAMFDEGKKEGNAEERNFGIFSPSGQPKYSVIFN